MYKGIKTILFATNLTRNCVPAFDFAVIMALRFQAKIVLLHVIEKIPNYVEGRLKGLLGDDHWEEMVRSHESEIRQKLIGKRSSSKLIQKALELFCTEAGIDDETSGYQSREVVICDGDIVESILEKSVEYDCDMVVMGAREGHLLSKTIGNTIKSVLRKSKIPVLVVPSDPNAKTDFPEVVGWRS